MEIDKDADNRLRAFMDGKSFGQIYPGANGYEALRTDLVDVLVQPTRPEPTSGSEVAGVLLETASTLDGYAFNAAWADAYRTVREAGGSHAEALEAARDASEGYVRAVITFEKCTAGDGA